MAEGNSANEKKMIKEDWEFQYEKQDSKSNSNNRDKYNKLSFTS